MWANLTQIMHVVQVVAARLVPSVQIRKTTSFSFVDVKLHAFIISILKAIGFLSPIRSFYKNDNRIDDQPGILNTTLWEYLSINIDFSRQFLLPKTNRAHLVLGDKFGDILGGNTGLALTNNVR